MCEFVLSLKRVVKSYETLRALNSVDFHLRAGEVRALMGRNGAGKSTLVRIIGGAERADDGDIELTGHPVSFRSPLEAIKAGIAIVHQELTIVPGLTVAENIFLGDWPAFAGTIRKQRMLEKARATLSNLGSAIQPDREAGLLSIAGQQIVEIARALARNPKVLILDEPTSSLPGREVEGLLSAVRRLAAHNVAVIYVSHRMDEISRVADSVTVLRDGNLVANLPINEAPPNRIADLMTGAEIPTNADFRPKYRAVGRGQKQAAKVAAGTDVLTVSGLAAGPISGMNLSIAAGEVVGLAGLLGSGRSKALRAIAGVDRPKAGAIALHDVPVSAGSVRSALAIGIALVPEDRKHEGLIVDLPIADNLVMSCLNQVSRFGIINANAQSKIANASRQLTEIKAPDMSLPASTLSGGNQQKVVFARCINSGARLLLLDEPTRGVDVHGKRQIYDLISKFAEAGGAVLLVSSEYEELLMLCHRVLIVSGGQVRQELLPHQSNLTELMTGLIIPTASSVL